METLEGLSTYRGTRFDLAFVDFYLIKDRSFGVDAVPLITADTIVGYSSDAAALALIADTARKLGCDSVVALEKDKSMLASPALEVFLSACLRSRERQITMHIVLAGDSIFDNGSYVPDVPCRIYA